MKLVLSVLVISLSIPVIALAASRSLDLRQGLFSFSLLMTGVLSGIFVCTELGQSRVQQTLNAEQFTFLKQRFELALGGVMPPLLIITTLSPIPLLFSLRRPLDPSFVLVGIAAVLWVGATVATLVYNVPVNKLAASWDPNHPRADWEVLRRKWHLGQSIRTALTVPGFTALLAAALLDKH